MPQVLEKIGAGEGNRTLVISLEGFCSTIELHPRRGPPDYNIWATAKTPRHAPINITGKNIGRAPLCAGNAHSLRHTWQGDPVRFAEECTRGIGEPDIRAYDAPAPWFVVRGAAPGLYALPRI